MKVMKSTRAMPSPPPAGHYLLHLQLSGFTWEPVMRTGMRATMVTMRMLMRRKKHRKPLMD
jgi:hypothetical protein